MIKECPMNSTCMQAAGHERTGLKYESLDLGYSLDIGHWTLVILRPGSVSSLRIYDRFKKAERRGAGTASSPQNSVSYRAYGDEAVPARFLNPPMLRI